MRKIIIILIFIPVTVSCQSDFKSKQKLYERVRTAYSEKEDSLILYAKELGFDNLENDILIVGYKDEQTLEIWAKKKDTTAFSLFKIYEFSAFSGILGPKRKEGDRQIPEGFYTISYFNPTSWFYLSLKVSYPNKSDKILGDSKQPGSDIYIHGKQITIGCIPITDEKIKELYVLAVEAKNSGQEDIPVYLFPTRLTNKQFLKMKDEYSENQELIDFWENIKTGYDLFENNHQELNYSIDSEGVYIFTED